MSYKAFIGSRRISAILIFFTLAFNAAAAAPSDRAQIAPGYQKLQSIAAQQGEVRVIVQVSDSGSPGGNRQQSINNALGKLKSGLAKSGIRPVKEYRKLPLMVFSVTSAQLDLLVDSGLVAFVYEDGIRRPTLFQSIPFIGGDVAHGAGLNGNGVAVAILDTGVDAGHTAFGGRVVEEACFSTRSGPSGSYSVCPNGSSNGQYGTGSAAPCNVDFC
ncbi:MAG: hypothetical protein OEU86_01465, partial [Gammaproteobacteria bacterium]|nr:hypothetical protein [Gammaproteobacteria bacterium]